MGKVCIENTPQGRRPRTIRAFSSACNKFLTVSLQSRRTAVPRLQARGKRNHKVEGRIAFDFP
jgi:hypothetical protein